MRITQKFYDFIVLLNSKYLYISTSDVIEDDEDWRLFFKKDILKYVRGIRDYDLKELCIFFADDFLSKKTEWNNFLLEKTILKTNSGGSLFYERLNIYLDNRDIDMSKCYLMALKFGFTGYKVNPLMDDYGVYLSRLKSFAIVQKEPMLQQYEGDLFVPRGDKPLGVVIFLVALIFIPLVVKIYYIIYTFNHLNANYIIWGY